MNRHSSIRAIFLIAALLIAHLGFPAAHSLHAASGPVTRAPQSSVGALPSHNRTSSQAPFIFMQQGRDSNCDYVAVANGVANIGGDGNWAYGMARQLVPQGPIDYREGFYTLYGSNGSDRAFLLDNLGAAPEAFVGVYETLGYDAVFMATSPGGAELAFAQAIHDRLAAAPDQSFAHLWITPRAYKAAARVFTVPTTRQQVPLLYPYHEVVALVRPDVPGTFIVIDGLTRAPQHVSIAQMASLLRGFNGAIVVKRGTGNVQEHQQFQFTQTGQPYVQPTLGGAYLTLARASWGESYQQWGQVIGQAYRTVDEQGERVVLPGMYVSYERRGTGSVGLSALGVQMARDLMQAGILPPGSDVPRQQSLTNGIRSGIEQQFGSTDTFSRTFGVPLTGEFWITAEQMRDVVFRGVSHPIIDNVQDGFIAVVTERAMVIWHNEHGVVLVPLGQIYNLQLRHSLADTKWLR